MGCNGLGSCVKGQISCKQGGFCTRSHNRVGSDARMASFVGATAVADLVKSTLGPKGMDKIIQNVACG